MKKYFLISLLFCSLYVFGQNPKMYKISIVPFFREQTLSDMQLYLKTDINFKVKKIEYKSPSSTRPIISYFLIPKKKQLKSQYFFSINISGYLETERDIDFVAGSFCSNCEYKDTLSPQKNGKVIIGYNSSQLSIFREHTFTDGKYVFTFYIVSKDNFKTLSKEKFINIFLNARIEEYYRSP
jgi:hypothetical protein